ncbi:MAG: ABC transporter substrate-binding protein [Dehalococcoidia bacterium]|nr:ABC transporter substrate-binding protein [Dehalococcoidia bacterium]
MNALGRPGMLGVLAALLVAISAWACAPQAAPPPPSPTKGVTAPAAQPTAPAPQPTAAVATPTAAPAKPTLAPAAKVETINVGELGFMADSPFYIAFEKGYFREQGIDVKFQRFRSATDMIAPLATGELQVGGGSISAGLFNALARGVGIKVIANRSRPQIPLDSNWWMVRSDLKDQIKGFADFKGRSVNLTGPGNIVTYALGATLLKYGMTLKDLKTEELGAPETAAAFGRKAIDISLAIEPNATAFQEQGIAIKLVQMTKDIGPIDVASVMLGGKWAQENAELAKKFAVAYLKGHRDYIIAMQKGPNRKEVVDIAIKYTALKDPAAYEKIDWGSIPPDGYVDKESLKKTQDWFLQNAYQQDRADIDQLVDNSYLDYANQSLGKPKS